MGRILGIGGIFALIAVSQVAQAGEAPAKDELSVPAETPAGSAGTIEAPAAESPVEESAAPSTVESAAAEARPTSRPLPRGPRVIWAAPGQAPPRPRAALPVEEAPAPPPRARRFRLGNVRWVVGLERASSVAGYRSSIDGTDAVTTGVDASIVGQLSQDAFTPLVLPRLSVDRRWGNGFSLGLVFSYAARSSVQSSTGTDYDLPSSDSLLFGARGGWMVPLAGNVALWLRGGPTVGLRSGSELTAEPGELRTVTTRHWALSLEPQLVFMPLRHLGLSFGAAVDLGFDGESKVAYAGGPEPQLTRMQETVSTYGFTAGLLALF